MWTGTLALDLLLGDVRSLKQKRSVVRPIVAELRRRFAVSAAEAGHLDLHRRALVGVAVVAADRGHCVDVLAECEGLVAGRPEVEVLSARARILSGDDLDAGGLDVFDTEPGFRAGDRFGDDPSHEIPGAAGNGTTTGGSHG